MKRRAIGLLEEGGGVYANDAEDGRVKEAIRTVISKEQHKEGMSFYEWEKAEKRLYYAMRGYDVIEELMEDCEVSEIMINGMESIFYEKNGVLIKFPENFESEEDLYLMIERIVSRHNRKVNLKEPIVDTKCPDGSRVHVVLPPVSVTGPVVTIRRFLNKARTIADLIACGGITKGAADFLREAVRSRKTVLISGGTSSGKTTLLNALIDEIDENERIITIEDSAELKLDGRENAISLECRNKTAEGVNEVNLRDLIKASLRMRPDRIIVGEVRGAEALDLMQALNTGHEGSLCTLHANSCNDAILRLKILMLMGMELPMEAIMSQIVAGIDYIVQMKRNNAGKREVSEIIKLCGVENGEIISERIDIG
ncbi:MAG: CpaF family protein [Lachnospiraceae bacterium]|nr:CpaF family protein [Lachnospiraceae bacterium]MBO4462079.1 CpaF family protein [Lachnospiraceae bacterium]MBR5789641.1 CpaF family protein [Lachnospiraceae bacterium]